MRNFRWGWRRVWSLDRYRSVWRFEPIHRLPPPFLHSANNRISMFPRTGDSRNTPPPRLKNFGGLRAWSLRFTTVTSRSFHSQDRALGYKVHDTPTRPSRVAQGRPVPRVFCAVHMTRVFSCKIPRNLECIFCAQKRIFPFTERQRGQAIDTSIRIPNVESYPTTDQQNCLGTTSRAQRHPRGLACGCISTSCSEVFWIPGIFRHRP